MARSNSSAAAVACASSPRAAGTLALEAIGLHTKSRYFFARRIE
jgi:hypothetical protein